MLRGLHFETISSLQVISVINLVYCYVLFRKEIQSLALEIPLNFSHPTNNTSDSNMHQ